MPDSKLSALPVIPAPLLDTDTTYIVRGSTSFQVPISGLRGAPMGGYCQGNWGNGHSYMPLMGSRSSSESTLLNAISPCPRSGVLQNLSVRVYPEFTGSASFKQSGQFIVMTGSYATRTMVNSPLTCTISGGGANNSGWAFDHTDSVVVDADMWLALDINAFSTNLPSSFITWSVTLA